MEKQEDKELKAMGDSFRNIVKALDVIATKKEDAGKIACPECNGELYYRRAKSNGHVHGHCKTPGCLSWMQ